MTTPRVFVLGDSISMQYGPHLERYLTPRFHYSRKTGQGEAEANLDIPQGANGGDSSMVLQYLQAVQRGGKFKADILLINCGLHDVKTKPGTTEKQIEIGAYRENLQAIVKLAKQMAGEMVWVRTTPCDEAIHNQPKSAFHRFSADVLAYNAIADQIMKDAGVRMIDLFAFTTALGPNLYCDHVHFHEPIRQLQAAYIAGWLLGHLAQ